MTVIAFTVHGEPAPQGSKTVGRTKAGGSYVREDNPALAPWRNAVAAAAYKAMIAASDEGVEYHRDPIAGPVELDVYFVFARPRSHFRTGRHAGELKPSAPAVCSKRPDLDKLVRALGDAIAGVVVVDDAQVVELKARKHYGQPCAHVRIREVEP